MRRDLASRANDGYVRSTLQLFEDALSQSDLLPAFEQELARAR